MGSESTILRIDHAVDNIAIETSEVVNSDSSGVEEEKNSVSEEVFLQLPMGNKEGIKSPGTGFDIGNNSSYVNKAITSNGVAYVNVLMGCQTPRESIFDPFASAQEVVVCQAPKKKINEGSEVISRRQLNFEAGDFPVKRLSFDLDGSEEEELYLEVHNMFLDLIISNQFTEVGGKHWKNIKPPQTFETPVSRPLLTGMADTCPDAPLRLSVKPLKLNQIICRKLDFGAVSPKSSIIKDK